MNELLNKFVRSSDSEFAFLLHGEWGSGKTYFIKEEFLPSVKAKNKYYVSLFGVSSIEQIYSQLITQRLLGRNSGKFLRISTGVFTTVVKGVLNYFQGKTNIAPGEIDLKIADLIPIDDCVVIFDDLERVSGKTDFVGLLGQIHTYFVLEPSIRVIFVADENKIKGEVYKEYKEKIIGFQSTLEIDSRKSILSILKKKKDEKFNEFIISNLDFILKMIHSFEVKNLRIISYYFDVLKVLYREELNSMVSKKDFLYSVFVLSVEEKKNRLSGIRNRNDIPEYISKEKGDHSVKLSSDKNEGMFNRYTVALMRKSENYSFGYYFYESVFNVIRFGVLNHDMLSKEVKEVDDYKTEKRQSKLMSLVDRLKGYYYLTNTEYINAYRELIEELERPSDAISFDQLVFVSRLFFYLQNKPQLNVDANHLIEKYLYKWIDVIIEGNVRVYPQSILASLDREIGEVQRYDPVLSQKFDSILKSIQIHSLRQQAKRNIESADFSELSEYDFRIFLSTSSAKDVIEVIEGIKGQNGKLGEFTRNLERAFKIPIGSFNGIIKEDEIRVLQSLKNELVEYQKNLKLIENIWIDEIIKAIDDSLK